MGKEYRVKERDYLDWKEKYRVEEVEKRGPAGPGYGLALLFLVSLFLIGVGIWMLFQSEDLGWHMIVFGGGLFIYSLFLTIAPAPPSKKAAKIVCPVLFFLFVFSGFIVNLIFEGSVLIPGISQLQMIIVASIGLFFWIAFTLSVLLHR